MRPDEHKKKKNDQYKKKHGIKTKNQSVDAKPDAAKNVDHKSQKVVQGQGASQIHKPTEISSNSSEDEEVIENTPQFERRKVTNNWSRYEEVGTDDRLDISNSTTIKGADFQQLLTNNATNLSQFRFKDEQMWEEDITDTGSTSNYLSINCDELLTAIKCVPLHTRLGIEETHFEEDHLTILKSVAEKNLSEYTRQYGTTSNDSTEHNLESKTDYINNDKQVEILGTSDSQGQDMVSEKETIEKATIGTEDEVLQVKPSRDNQLVLNVQSKQTLAFTDTTEILELEELDKGISNHIDIDDLDELLGLSEQPKNKENKNEDIKCNSADILACERPLTPLQNQDLYPRSSTDVNVIDSEAICKKSNLKEVNKPITNNVVSFEDQLDELLQLNGTDNKTTKQQTENYKNNTENQDKNKEASNLEDWLDSVLED